MGVGEVVDLGGALGRASFTSATGAGHDLGSDIAPFRAGEVGLVFGGPRWLWGCHGDCSSARARATTATKVTPLCWVKTIANDSGHSSHQPSSATRWRRPSPMRLPVGVTGGRVLTVPVTAWTSMWLAVASSPRAATLTVSMWMYSPPHEGHSSRSSLSNRM